MSGCWSCGAAFPRSYDAPNVTPAPQLGQADLLAYEDGGAAEGADAVAAGFTYPASQHRRRVR